MLKDALDQEIETKRRAVEDARARVAALELELHTLERAAELRPSVEGNRRVSARPEGRAGNSQRGGRQLGAISKEWREILKRVAAAYPDGATAEDIASFGPGVGLENLRPRDSRQQAEKYLLLGYFERKGDRYQVTTAARERFGFPAEQPDFPTLMQATSEGTPYDEVA